MRKKKAYYDSLPQHFSIKSVHACVSVSTCVLSCVPSPLCIACLCVSSYVRAYVPVIMHEFHHRYVCVTPCVQTRESKCLRTCTYVYLFPCVCMCLYVRLYMYAQYVHMYTCVHFCTPSPCICMPSTCIYVRLPPLYVCPVRVYMYTCAFMYIFPLYMYVPPQCRDIPPLHCVEVIGQGTGGGRLAKCPQRTANCLK